MRAERARQRAEERLREWAAGKAELNATRAETALYRALARLQVARKGR
jgi:F0F1-type ATP synthase epsilon subunit